MTDTTENHPENRNANGGESGNVESTAAPGTPSRSGRRTSRLLAAVAGADDDRLPRGLVVIAASLVIVIGLGVVFHQLADILKPLFIAFFLTYLVVPAHRFLVRNNLPLIVSYLAIGITLAVLMFGFGRIVYETAGELSPKLKTYRAKLETVQRGVDDFFHRTLTFVGQKAEKIRPEALKGDEREGDAPGEAAREKTAEEGPEDAVFSVRLTDLLTQERLMAFIRSTVGSFFGLIPVIFIIIVYLIFLIAESDSIRRRIVHGVGEEGASERLELLAAINRAIAGYIRVKTLVSFLVAVISTAILWLFGVDFFIIWGVLTFLFNFIPFIGSIFAVSLPTALALVQFESPWTAVFVGLSLMAAQLSMAYGLEPRLAGRRLDLSPLVFLLALAFWVSIWGLVGAVLAIPLAVTIKIILEHFDATRPVAMLLSNDPGDDSRLPQRPERVAS